MSSLNAGNATSTNTQEANTSNTGSTQGQRVDLSSCAVDLAVVQLIPKRMAQDLSVLALWRSGNKLSIAISDANDIHIQNAVKTHTGLDPEPMLASDREIQSAIDRFYSIIEDQAEPQAPVTPHVPASAPGVEEKKQPEEEALEIYHIDDLLNTLLERSGSDLHICTGSPPAIRVHGELVPTEYENLTAARIQQLLYAILTDEHVREFEETHELDFAYSVPGLSRFRVNLHWQRGSVGAVFRTVPMMPPDLSTLGMPQILTTLCYKPRGLVLVTGPTGSGKSTTLAAMVREINEHRRCHIVTVEDPIEFLHRHRQSIIIQREVGSDTFSFANALRHVLRQDPDVILIGEMRDLETIASAVTAAETGHLVFATLHTTSASQTVDRIIDVFPPHQQNQVRLQLASVLEGIICQTLLPRLDGKGRACVQEILVATPAARNLIREGKSHQLASVLQSGGQFGMQTLDLALKVVVMKGLVAPEIAASASSSPDEFTSLMQMG